MSYAYGEQVEYEHSLIKLEDLGKLQAFSCGNKKLDHFYNESNFFILIYFSNFVFYVTLLFYNKNIQMII